MSYLDCAKFLMAETVHLRSTAHVTSFIPFMCADNLRRWRYLWSLHLGSDLDARATQVLVKHLHHATSLELLCFKDSEITLALDPALPSAFAALPNISHITAQPAGEHTWRMFEAMHWPLKTAELLWSSVPFEFLWQGRVTNPAVLLKNSRETLQRLKSLFWKDLDDALTEEAAVYPALVSLSIRGVPSPHTADWALFYPNVKSLDFHTFSGSGLFSKIRDAASEFGATRQHSLAQQQDRGAWAHLEEVDASSMDLYISGLPCQIPRLRTTLSNSSLQVFPIVLEYARPHSLDLDVSSDVHFMQVPDQLSHPGLKELRCLKVHVDSHVSLLRTFSFQAEFEEFLDDFTNALKPRIVDALHLQIAVTHQQFPPSLEIPDDLAIFFSNLHLDDVARRMTEEVASLKHVTLQFKWDGQPAGEACAVISKDVDTD
ncbi:hypothetical protein L227DRAFT_657037 [Lentinus tigrinus ALCF2SS1-6]|uniref:F-box domain-containing protein n=2 Tax=Lentinus tigrinus TaxID=5365 RepID=A0A5C2RWK3_9APHY|nr:hypothetical protein L227DRAFT_657037 [Lentinus tigrinus ALCF2SS1-6]